MTAGEKITKASGSNLAFALIALPPEKLRDMQTFYAFCRVVDDLADEPDQPIEDRRRALAIWRTALHGPVEGEHELATEFRAVLERYPIDRSLPEEIITGMEMDLAGHRYATLEDLQLYCYRVAGAVGLVSIEIFGYRHPSAKDHAKALGEALQLTNILRDVAEDYRNGQRIYLPLEEMASHGYTEDDLAARRWNENWLALAESLAATARENYTAAERYLHPEDRRNLLPGLIMADIYGSVLRKMERDQYRIYSRRYSLTKLEKLFAVLTRTLRTRFFSQSKPSSQT